jgi:hypothetical protein
MEDPILSTLKRIQSDQVILSKLSDIAASDITPSADGGNPEDPVVVFLNRILGNPEALRVFKEIMRPGPGIVRSVSDEEEAVASGEGEAVASGEGEAVGEAVASGEGEAVGEAVASGEGEAVASGEGEAVGEAVASGEGETVGETSGEAPASGEGETVGETVASETGAVPDLRLPGEMEEDMEIFEGEGEGEGEEEEEVRQPSSTRSLGDLGISEGVEGVDTRGRSASFARRTRKGTKKNTKKNTKKRQTTKKHNKTKRRR